MTNRLNITDLPRDETFSLGTLRSALVKEYNDSRRRLAKMTAFRDTVAYALTRADEILLEYTPPVVTLDPNDQSATEGDRVVMTVAGNNYTSIRWFKDGEDFGQSGETLALDPVALADAGVYKARFRNDVGYTDSADATVTVEAAPEPDVAVAVATKVTAKTRKVKVKETK